MSGTALPPIHPGEILKEEFLIPFGLSINALARGIHVAPNRISQIVNSSRAITGDTALRFSEFFGTTPEFWMNLQSLYELEIARRKRAATKKVIIRRYSPPVSQPVLV
jgi:addiction module HigA family antidote